MSMKERQEKSRVDGLLLLNKPAGITSNQALQKVKRLLGARKAGHTGSLDPAATGMLPLCFGEATKVCSFLLNADKTYRVVAKLGSATDTADADGKVIAEAAVPQLEKEEWDSIFSRFVGEQMQIPPMYSALKKDGKRLYELARKGETVEREARPVNIYELNLLEVAGNRLVFRVSCSKGTYVRTLVEDIAKAAGTLAYTASLHRESVGAFNAEDMLDMAGAESVAEAGPDALRNRLLAADIALGEMPMCHVAATDTSRFCGGQAVPGIAPGCEGLVRVYGQQDEFLGVGIVNCDGIVSPKRVFRLGG